ncbi:MAG TPA: cyclic nucleotide-binding domain-containing protein [Verrucomicrobiae bacterium]|jgi:Fe-S-cluster-containing dehydrogenase component/CRP-like cAMP-binding protein
MPAIAPVLERPDRWDAAFDPEMTDADVDRLLSIPPFSKMTPSNFPKRTPLREILRNDTKVRKFLPDELIVRVGDYGTSAFLILNGKARVVLKPELPPSMLGRKAPERKGIFKTLAQAFSYRRPPESFRRSDLKKLAGIGATKTGEVEEVHVYLQDVPRILRDFRTGELSQGDIFGEIAALSRMPRTSTIFADSEGAELLEIRWQGLRDLMKYDDALRTYIDQIYRARALESFFLANPLFSKLNKAQLREVGLQVQFATFGDYDWSGDYKRLAQSGAVRPEKEPLIVQEGDYPNGVVLVRAGFARVSQKFGSGERTLNYLGAGASFGLQEIYHNFKNPARPVSMRYTLRAIGYTHVLIVPTYVMEQMILPNADPKFLPPPLKPIEENQETQDDDRPEGARIGRDYLEFLAANRFFNGTAAMVIDLDRCTRCDDCVRACAATHDNNPRFLRHGPSSGRIMIANACMHCADPVCMIGCPTGAIHRESFAGQVVINPVTCIGCTACANNCPYDAIRMVDIRDERGDIILGEDLKPIAKATKCDLCVENYGGPACERACPHGALERMDLNDLKPLARWMNR